MATNTAVFPGRPTQLRARVELWLVSQDIVNNRSLCGAQVIAEEIGSGWAGWSYDPVQFWSGSLTPGHSFGGAWTYDYTPGGLQAVYLVNSTYYINHNADGTGSAVLSAYIDTDNSPGAVSLGVSLTLPRIPRGPRIKQGGQYKNSIAYVKQGGQYKIAIPYVKSGGLYKIGGG
jgi:hypothetical protein